MLEAISESQWREFDDRGYLNLGTADSSTLRRIQNRIDDIMMGRAAVQYDRMLMQLDSTTGVYEDAGPQTKGFKGATLGYRKIQDLEFDPLFLEYIQYPVFNEICRRTYGANTPVAVFRSMFMNKPANRGTFLPWHQDRWTQLDRDPQITVWTAIDPATRENGCLQVIPGSHRNGLINPAHPSGFLNKTQAAEICTGDRIVYVELEEGEVVLLHNYLLHASDINRSDGPRRALSVCYMDAATLENGGPNPYTVVFGPNALKPESLKPGV